MLIFVLIVLILSAIGDIITIIISKDDVLRIIGLILNILSIIFVTMYL